MSIACLRGKTTTKTILSSAARSTHSICTFTSFYVGNKYNQDYRNNIITISSTVCLSTPKVQSEYYESHLQAFQFLLQSWMEFYPTSLKLISGTALSSKFASSTRGRCFIEYRISSSAISSSGSAQSARKNMVGQRILTWFMMT